MSEIKGQLLGIVLVIAVFAVVGAALVTAFSNATKKVATEIEKEPTGLTPTQVSTLADDGLKLLTF